MKYDVSDRFGFFKNFSPPFNKFIVHLWPWLIKRSYRVLYKEDISVQKIDLKNFCIYLAMPKGGKNLPCVIYFHGGAFVFPAYVSHYKTGISYLKKGNIAVAFVDYGLVPKRPYPCAEEDCQKALSYIFENAEALSIDRSKIGVMGDSAGGNLAAKTSAFAQKMNYPLACQLYFYPVIDPDIDTESKRIFKDTPMWDSVRNKRMWNYYFSGKTPSECGYKDILSDDFSPSFAPAYVETCEFDCLRDEGRLFYESLVKKGIQAKYYMVKQSMHGYEIKDCQITRDAIDRRVDFFVNAFNNVPKTNL